MYPPQSGPPDPGPPNPGPPVPGFPPPPGPPVPGPPQFGATQDYGQPPFVAPPPPKKRSKAPLIILGVVGAMVLLCCGGGALALVAAEKDKKPGTAAPLPSTSTPSTSSSPTPDPSTSAVQGDLDRYKVGDCLTIADISNRVKPAKCTDSGAYKVLLRKDGTLAESACDSTDAESYLTSDATGTTRDFILCIKKAQ